MNTLFIDKTKTSLRHLRRGWVVILIFIMLGLTACKGNTQTASNPSDNNLPLVNLNIDLAKVVLGPKDVPGLFDGVTYSITQGISSAQSNGEVVTYPTDILPHTTAFASGFSTRVEIFKTLDQAINSYAASLTQQSGKTLKINSLGNESSAFSGPAVTPEGFDLNSTEYAVLFRDRNAVVAIIVRTDKNVSPAELTQLAQLVVDRLQQ